MSGAVSGSGGALNVAGTSGAADIQTYTRKQSDEIWNVARDGQNHFGYNWHVAFDGAAARRQSSALDALITAYAVSSPL